MPSPFPGMDPYLENEGHWHSFHQGLCTACWHALVPQVQPNYIVKTGENEHIREPDANERRLLGRPDVFVARAKPSTPGRGSGAGGGSLLAPVLGEMPFVAVDEERIPYLKIIDRRNHELVTVLEILSPTNKGSGIGDYIAKRNAFLRAGVGYVEIDLLRGGERPPVIAPESDCDYRVVVVRGGETQSAGIWPLRLIDPLPAIPIPLRAGDVDAKLDLQALLHEAYDRGGFGSYIYEDPPTPPLDPLRERWALELIGQRTM